MSDQTRQECAAIIELGRATYGTANFDEASQTVASALGQERMPDFMAVVGDFDDPAAIIIHLANNESRLKKHVKIAELELDELFPQLPPPLRAGLLLAEIFIALIPYSLLSPVCRPLNRPCNASRKSQTH